MQKKIIALAIAAAFSAPAFADNANVTVYGKALMTLDQYSSDTPDTAKNTKQVRVNTNASRFGVKGSEDLGDGLKALYQYEVEMDADGSGANGMGKTRNSGAGMEGGFGKVILGIWDTPFKTAHNAIELFDNTTSWTSTLVIGRSAGKNYNTRQANMIQYWSPKFSGFQVAAMYSPDEARSNTQNKAITSISGTYDQDALYISAAYETRSDASVASNVAGTVAGVPDTATRLVAKYKLADFWLGAMVERMKTNFLTGTVVDSVTGQNSELVGGFKFGANSIALSLAKQGDTSTNGTANGVTQTSLKYAYDFSKRTEVFAAFTTNKADGIAAPTVKTTVTTTYLGGGVIHSF